MNRNNPADDPLVKQLMLKAPVHVRRTFAAVVVEFMNHLEQAKVVDDPIQAALNCRDGMHDTIKKDIAGRWTREQILHFAADTIIAQAANSVLPIMKAAAESGDIDILNRTVQALQETIDIYIKE
jgi:hypothetical protein